MYIKNIIGILILCVSILTSCNKEEPELPTNNENNQENTDDRNNNSNNSSNTTEDQYYFKFTTLASREIKTEAGSTQIFFECNQDYSITVESCGGSSVSITGLNINPTSGKGSGYVTVSYGNVQYKESGNQITWNECNDITFNVKEGPKSNYKNVKKQFYLVRRGSKMKV